ncbi:hypothetical protein ABVK25_011830 [Lepraria finkii]|uniref:Laccase n=1 Tax=Lepraria finkii TaxID=1340010 RepID=A0ABR4ALX8_9LECA
MFRRSYLLAILQSVLCASATTYNWNVGWITENPDGLHPRPVITINGQWPPPTLSANVGDTVTINLKNNLGNETTGLHFHGLFQNGTNSMDGPTQVTQCPIGPGETFTQTFQVNQPGTYWYHSHNRGQYPDGFRGALIIHDPSNPYAGQYDQEEVLVLSDWYHKQIPDLIPGFLSTTANPSGAEPVPDSAILNDNATTSFSITPGKTYMFRIINVSNFASFLLKFDQHQMAIIEVDGVYTVKQSTDLIYITAGQRYSVLITAKATAPGQNYAFVGAMDPNMFDCNPCPGVPLNATGYLIYDATKPLPKKEPTFPSYTSGFYDDFSLVPYDKQALFEPVTKRITLNVESGVYFNQNRFAINDVTYVEPKVPTLFTVLDAGNQATNPVIYGEYANPYIVSHNDVVEIVVNNGDSGGHPIHMHGHNFQMVERSPPYENPHKAPGTPTTTPPATPIRRDVMKVQASGYLVYRFRADNPDKSLPSLPFKPPTNTPSTRLGLPLPYRLAPNRRLLRHHHRSPSGAPGTKRPGGPDPGVQGSEIAVSG